MQAASDGSTGSSLRVSIVGKMFAGLMGRAKSRSNSRLTIRSDWKDLCWPKKIKGAGFDLKLTVCMFPGNGLLCEYGIE